LERRKMNKLTYRLMSVLAVFILMLGNSSSVVASAAYGASQAAAAIPAFPGAEGFGANTIGGRGGIIYEVTNLNDAGTGSLRACIEATGPRTCVFRTGGLIVLQSALRIVNPYITIAGQTAPGGGITLKNVSGGSVFSTQTHDVIIRYITSRPGPGGMNNATLIAKNNIPLYNIIIDHGSFSWATDETLTTWYRTYNVTIQWNIVSESLDCSTHPKGCHSKGLMIGGYSGSESAGGKGSENISVLNNLMAHNAERNPLMQLCGIAQVINNTTYNPQWTFAHQQLNCPLGESYVNWINNYHKKGPSSTSNTDLKIIPADDGTWSAGKVYVKGNIGPNRPNDTLVETKWVELKSGAPAGVLVTSPAPAPAVYSTSAMEAFNCVIADGGAGNSRGLNCDGSWYNRRDSIDVRVINEVKTGTGKIIDDPSQVGGWIVPAAGVPCADSDHDGMPDTWEQLYGFNLNIPNGSEDKDGDGYTNVEEYFNGTNPGDSILVPSITPTLVPVATSTPTLMPTSTLPIPTISASPVPASVTATQSSIPPTVTLLPATPTTVSTGQNTFEVRVAKGADDVEESSTGSIYINSSDLELVYDGSNQVVGMRFRGVSVPKGATITNAYLQFKVDETSSEVTKISINGEAKSNALAFSNTKHNVSARLRTINTVSWSPSSWMTLGAVGIDQRTPNLSPIVQEIVSQTSWVAGNSMVMIITGSGKRVAKAYEVDPAGAPLLHIEYIVAATSATNMFSLTTTTVPTTNTPAATATIPAIANSPTVTLLPETPTTSVTDIPSSTMSAPWTQTASPSETSTVILPAP
jgi:pectate lyase